MFCFFIIMFIWFIDIIFRGLPQALPLFCSWMFRTPIFIWSSCLFPHPCWRCRTVHRLTISMERVSPSRLICLPASGLYEILLVGIVIDLFCFSRSRDTLCVCLWSWLLLYRLIFWSSQRYWLVSSFITFFIYLLQYIKSSQIFYLLLRNYLLFFYFF